jgi:hypothetical protein
MREYGELITYANDREMESEDSFTMYSSTKLTFIGGKKHG